MTRPIKNLSGAVATGDGTHVGTNDIDQTNNLLTGQDQSATDPVTIATTTTFNNAKLRLKTPTTGKNVIINTTDVAADKNVTVPALSADDTIAFVNQAQTLAGKTLTSPVISSISNTGTLTLPTVTDTLVGRTTTDTMTNKTLTSPVLTTPTIGSGGFTLRNPANTQSLTVVNPAISSAQNYQFNDSYDYYVFIDTDDSNKIKAKSGRTGGIEFSHATDAGNVINSCCNALINTGGMIRIGAGTFNINSLIQIYSHTSIIGFGSRATILQLQAGNNGAQVYMILSHAFLTLAWTNDMHGDNQCTLAALSLDGNKANNTGNTHALVKYGYDWRIYDIAIYNFTGNGIISQWSSSPNVPPDPNDMFLDHVHDITIHHCNGWAVWHMGPNNSYWRGVTSYFNGEGSFLIQTIGNVIDGGFQLSDSHIFFNNQNHLAPNATHADIDLQSYLKMSHVIVETDAGIGIWVRPPVAVSYTPVGGVLTNNTTIPAQLWADGIQQYNFNGNVTGSGAGCVLASPGSYINGEWERMNLYAPGGCAVLILADNNKVDGTFMNNTDQWGAGHAVGNDGSAGTTALQIGNGTTAVHNCYISGNFYNNAIGINWGNASNANNVVVANITTFGALGPAAAQIDVTNLGAAMNTNTILIHSSGAGTNNVFTLRPLNQLNALTMENKTLTLNNIDNTNSFTGTAATATAGGGVLPATPTAFITINVNGVAKKIPYYNV